MVRKLAVWLWVGMFTFAVQVTVAEAHAADWVLQEQSIFGFCWSTWSWQTHDHRATRAECEDRC